LLVDAKLNKNGQTLRGRFHSKGKLENLDKSLLANLMGIDILLFTADGSLIMQKRSKKVAAFPGKLCPAASGTVSALDVPNNSITLKDMPKLREAFEEIGVRKEDIPGEKIFFLGITRELIRGGQPEMFFFAETSLSKNDVIKRWKDARDSWESKALVFYDFGSIAHKNLTTDQDKQNFLCKVDKFLDEYMDQSSPPLLANFALWIKFRISRHPKNKKDCDK
jgi:hypothetical protein